MKFGENFNKLSIPQWKSYNLDYNDLKHKVRSVTSVNVCLVDPATLETSLVSLDTSINQQIDFLNLFINTKKSEIERKLSYYQNLYSNLNTHSNNGSQLDKLNHELITELNHLSLEIRDLSRFMLYQKIAINKLFKKFNKHYIQNILIFEPNFNLADSDSERQKHDVINNYKNLTSRIYKKINSDKSSFLNMNLNDVIMELTFFLELIKESHSLREIRRTSSFDLSNTNLTLNLNYDLNSLINNNYHDTYILDYDNLNDLKLVLINELSLINDKKSHLESLISHIYLVNPQNPDQYSVIISEKDKPDSIIISPITKFTNNPYCIVPNALVNEMLTDLNNDSQGFLAKIDNYHGLTKLALDYILKHNLKPHYKFFANRLRFLEKFKKVDKFDVTISNDYYIHLDTDLYYKFDKNSEVEFDTDYKLEYEKFKYAQLSMNYNDEIAEIIEKFLNLSYLYKINFKLVDYLNYKFLKFDNDIIWSDFLNLNLNLSLQYNLIESRQVSNSNQPYITPINPISSILEENEESERAAIPDELRYWNEFDNPEYGDEEVAYEYNPELNISLIEGLINKLIYFYKMFNKKSINHSRLKYTVSTNKRHSITSISKPIYDEDSDDEGNNGSHSSDGDAGIYRDSINFIRFMKFLIANTTLMSFVILVISILLFVVNTKDTVWFRLFHFVLLCISMTLSGFSLLLASNYSYIIKNSHYYFINDLENVDNNMELNIFNPPRFRQLLIVYLVFFLVSVGFVWSCVILLEN